MELLNKTKGSEYWKVFFEGPNINSALFCEEHKLSDIDSKELFKKYVCIVNLETSTVCNRKCSYCPLSIYKRDEQILIDDCLYSKIISELSSIDYHSTVSLNLYNEPLLDSKIYSRIEELRKKCPNCFIKFNSNGDYLTREIMDKLVESGLNAIFLTLHVPSGKEYSDEDRLKAFKMFFEKLGLDYKIDEVMPNEKIVSDVYYKGMRLLIEAHNWSEFGNDRGGTLDFLSSKSRTSPCVRPLREFTIAFDGRVYPCCQFFPDCEKSNSALIDKIDENNTIFDIYSSNMLRGWRRKLFTFEEKQNICKTCKDVDFSEDDGVLRKEILNCAKKSAVVDLTVLKNGQFGKELL